jgi:hypothetical protein
MINFFETEKKLTIEEINKIEEELNFSLHTTYKNHLLNFNGGRCEPNIFDFIENGQKTSSNIDWFLAIYDGEYDNFKDYFEIYKLENKRMPDNIFPIAHDPGGNLICFDNIYGKIYFWNHEMEVDYEKHNDSNMENLYFLSDNLESFLLGLKNKESV